MVLLSGTLLPPSPPRGLQIAKCLFLAFFKNPILEVTSTYGATVTFTLGFCPTIFLGITIYNVFTLVISVLQWKIGSGKPLLVKYVVSMLAASAPCLWVGGWPKRGSLPNACCAYLHILSPPLSFFILLMRPSYQCHRRRRTDFDNQKYSNVRHGKVPVILNSGS